MTQIYLIRHGEAEGNVFRRFHGQYDALLTPRGQQQVKCVEKRFENIHIDVCYSSDLTRTSLTARSIYEPKGLKLHRDPRFREGYLGIWEDLPYGYLDRYEPVQMHNYNHAPLEWSVPGAENFETYTGRFLEALTEVARKHEGQTVAIFAHGTVIRGTLARLFYDRDVTKLPYSDNTGVSKLFFEDGNFSYEFLNDNSHLPQELSTFAIQFWWRVTDNRKEANLDFLPYDPEMELPEGLSLPEMDERGYALAAILNGSPIGLVAMAAPEGDDGRILGMTIREDLNGRLYGDQMLGAAFSHFRHLGCRNLVLNPGWYPDDISVRYEFDPETRMRSIDTKVFHWGDGV